MTERIRCPSCRGTKTVTKLGGMTGDCNFCEGKGTILSAQQIKDIPVPVKEEPIDSIVSQVAECVPASIVDESATVGTKMSLQDSVLKSVSPLDSKTQAKRVSFQRKKG